MLTCMHVHLWCMCVYYCTLLLRFCNRPDKMSYLPKGIYGAWLLFFVSARTNKRRTSSSSRGASCACERVCVCVCERERVCVYYKHQTYTCWSVCMSIFDVSNAKNTRKVREVNLLLSLSCMSLKKSNEQNNHRPPPNGRPKVNQS